MRALVGKRGVTTTTIVVDIVISVCYCRNRAATATRHAMADTNGTAVVGLLFVVDTYHRCR